MYLARGPANLADKLKKPIIILLAAFFMLSFFVGISGGNVVAYDVPIGDDAPDILPQVTQIAPDRVNNLLKDYKDVERVVYGISIPKKYASNYLVLGDLNSSQEASSVGSLLHYMWGSNAKWFGSDPGAKNIDSYKGNEDFYCSYDKRSNNYYTITCYWKEQKGAIFDDLPGIDVTYTLSKRGKTYCKSNFLPEKEWYIKGSYTFSRDCGNVSHRESVGSNRVREGYLNVSFDHRFCSGCGTEVTNMKYFSENLKVNASYTAQAPLKYITNKEFGYLVNTTKKFLDWTEEVTYSDDFKDYQRKYQASCNVDSRLSNWGILGKEADENLNAIDHRANMCNEGFNNFTPMGNEMKTRDAAYAKCKNKININNYSKPGRISGVSFEDFYYGCMAYYVEYPATTTDYVQYVTATFDSDGEFDSAPVPMCDGSPCDQAAHDKLQEVKKNQKESEAGQTGKKTEGARAGDAPVCDSNFTCPSKDDWDDDTMGLILKCFPKNIGCGMAQAVMGVGGSLTELVGGRSGFSDVLNVRVIKGSSIEGVIKAVWEFITNLINSFILLAFLVGVFLTLIRVPMPSWQIQKMIPNIIIGIFLINSSYFISHDLVLGLMNALVSKDLLGGASLGEVKKIYDAGGKTVFWAFIQAIIGLVYAVLYLYLYVLFWLRKIVLYILLMFAAAPYITMVIPIDQIKGITSKWWEQFLNWAIMGPFALIFIWISAKVAGISGDFSAGSGLQGFSNDLMQVVMMSILIYLAVTQPLKLGGEIMSKASGALNKGIVGGAKLAAVARRSRVEKVAGMKDPKTKLQKFRRGIAGAQLSMADAPKLAYGKTKNYFAEQQKKNKESWEEQSKKGFVGGKLRKLSVDEFKEKTEEPSQKMADTKSTEFIESQIDKAVAKGDALKAAIAISALDKQLTGDASTANTKIDKKRAKMVMEQKLAKDMGLTTGAGSKKKLIEAGSGIDVGIMDQIKGSLLGESGVENMKQLQSRLVSASEKSLSNPKIWKGATTSQFNATSELIKAVKGKKNEGYNSSTIKKIDNLKIGDGQKTAIKTAVENGDQSELTKIFSTLSEDLSSGDKKSLTSLAKKSGDHNRLKRNLEVFVKSKKEYFKKPQKERLQEYIKPDSLVMSSMGGDVNKVINHLEGEAKRILRSIENGDNAIAVDITKNVYAPQDKNLSPQEANEMAKAMESAIAEFRSQGKQAAEDFGGMVKNVGAAVEKKKVVAKQEADKAAAENIEKWKRGEPDIHSGGGEGKIIT